MRSRLTAADLLLIATCVIWGMNFVVVKSTLAEIPPLAFNGIRFSVAAAFLLLLQWRLEGLAVIRPLLWRLVAIGLAGNLFYQMLFILGLDRTQASQAGLFASTTPLWVALFARLSGHDRLSARVFSGILLAGGGVVLLLWESFYGAGALERYWVGNLMLLGASVSWAIYTVYSQPLLMTLRPLAVTSATMLSGAVPLLILGIPDILRIEPQSVSLSSWLGLAYSTLMALVFGYFSWARGVKAIGSARTAVYINLVPVVATATAWVWLGERLSPRQLLGAAAVVAGIGLSRRRERTPRRIDRDQ